MRRKHKRIVLGVVLAPTLLPVIVAIFLIAERVRGKISLANYRKTLAAQGEKVTPAEFATHPDPSLNGAPLLKLAIDALKEGKTVGEHLPSCMRLTESGTAIAGFREDEWTEDGATYNWTQVAAELETNAAALEQARAALQKPAFDNQLNYEAGAKLLLPHLSNGKRLCRMFGASAHLALHKGSTAESMDPLVAQVHLLRSLENDRLLISELVRIAVASIGRSYVWEALQAEGWSDADLARLSAAWKEPKFIEAMARALEGERIYIGATYDIMRKSNEETVSILYWMEDEGFNAAVLMGLSDDVGDGLMDEGIIKQIFKFFRNEVYCRVWRFAWLDQAECRYMRHTQSLVEMARDAAGHKSMLKVETGIALVDEKAMPRNLYDRLRMPGQDLTSMLSRSLSRVMRMETERSLLQAAIALKRYHIRENNFPDSLQTLVPQFLESVPFDYMDGKPLRYQTNPDGTFLLYSVGADGTDASGNTSVIEGKSLRNIWDRPDVVWPVEEAP